MGRMSCNLVYGTEHEVGLHDKILTVFLQA